MSGVLAEPRGKAVVVTGAASGIGRALALHAAGLGMRVLACDVDERGLASLARELERAGASAVRVRRVDVSRSEELEQLADEAWSAFGAVHLLFNNAGVLLGGSAWERSEADWRWVIDVNLFGVVNGVRAFVPRMLSQLGPSHIVNTASIGGLITGPYLSPYIVSKHAVVALSEALYYELQAAGGQVAISVLCPGAVATGIGASERVRPESLGEAAPLTSDSERAFMAGLQRGIAKGIAPAELASAAFAGVRDGRFWILPDPSYRERFEKRAESICEGSHPPALA